MELGEERVEEKGIESGKEEEIGEEDGVRLWSVQRMSDLGSCLLLSSSSLSIITRHKLTRLTCLCPATPDLSLGHR